MRLVPILRPHVCSACRKPITVEVEVHDREPDNRDEVRRWRCPWCGRAQQRRFGGRLVAVLVGHPGTNARPHARDVRPVPDNQTPGRSTS
jgi:hypothetical protein